jgi:hypothetical protein
MKEFLFNTEYFCIVDSYVWLKNTHRTHFSVSIATVVTRTVVLQSGRDSASDYATTASSYIL